MKKIVLLIFITCLSLSCSNDDGQSVSIVDEWSFEKTGTMDNDTYEITNEDEWISDCSTKKDYIILTSSNTFTANFFTSACESTFFAQENGSYTLNATNDILTISGGTDWDSTYKIVTLNETELILKIEPGVSDGKNINRLPEYNFIKFSRRN